MHTIMKLNGGSYFTKEGVIAEFDIDPSSLYPGSVIVIKNGDDNDAAYKVGMIAHEVYDNAVVGCVCYVSVLDKFKRDEKGSTDSTHPHRTRVLLG